MRQRTREQDGAVAKLAERGAFATHHAEYDVTRRGFLADRRGANCAPDPGQHCLYLLVGRRGFEAGGTVEIADSRQPPSESARSPTTGSLIRQEAAHPRWRGRQRDSYAASVVLALLARAKSAASSSVAASSAGGVGWSTMTSAFFIAATFQNERYRRLSWYMPGIYIHAIHCQTLAARMPWDQTSG
jgi:hypothetical protein